MIGRSVACLVLWLPSAGHAQDFTTAAEVKPVLAATRASWISLREFGGQDLIYFTHLESWRCGLTQIRYGLNGTPPTEVWVVEPCFEGTAQPNALGPDRLPYSVQPAGSVAAVTVAITYDDGTEDRAEFARAAMLIR